ncbi:type I-E CRISPR-associated protein Cas7/Cse4/CasC [Streptomyces sp. NPDC056831]|uniref:type I-E CRISPR-associated protein Cas7/Cse4/CasC n=1 Tax=Streptomyces sp. NPDC056831 TaxID=3345954 RepID=UPI0036C3C1E9
MTAHATDLSSRTTAAEQDITDVTRSPGPFVVVHSLTTLAGVNLNRDMNDLPKMLPYGGVDRMRVSSQSLVRAAREFMRTDGTHDVHNAVSTRLLPTKIAQHLEEEHGIDPADAVPAAALIVTAIGLGIHLADPGRTRALTYVPDDTALRLSRLVASHWDRLHNAREQMEELIAGAISAPATAQDPPAKKESPAAALPGFLVSAARATLEPGTVEELAVFGRFLPEIPYGRVDSATDVAHGFSVDPLQLFSDDFTAKDDYQDGGVFSGAGMLGQQYLVSGTLYRQAALDRRQLRKTLAHSGEDGTTVEALAQRAERRWTNAVIHSLPSSKRSRTGSPPRPTLAVIATCDQALTAAPAFESPISPPAGIEAAQRLATRLRNAGLRGGVALWSAPAREDPPPLPEELTVKDW